MLSYGGHAHCSPWPANIATWDARQKSVTPKHLKTRFQLCLMIIPDFFGEVWTSNLLSTRNMSAGRVNIVSWHLTNSSSHCLFSLIIFWSQKSSRWIRGDCANVFQQRSAVKNNQNLCICFSVYSHLAAPLFWSFRKKANPWAYIPWWIIVIVSWVRYSFQDRIMAKVKLFAKAKRIRNAKAKMIPLVTKGCRVIQRPFEPLLFQGPSHPGTSFIRLGRHWSQHGEDHFLKRVMQQLERSIKRFSSTIQVPLTKQLAGCWAVPFVFLFGRRNFCSK